ncbi:hypothetical protein DdX_20977 [Ditylenchus destructor]|uniref:Lipoprotein n=1 Tax=Ditylenchus destructor TaxID=166010 RepID=A0AAD4QRL0_9BILA|nr:hypothetical protein DdX_20977 [Ditylenchus destructor]
MKRVLLPLAAVAALGLAACSDKAKNEAAEAANAIGADVQRHHVRREQDVKAATEGALGTAENTADSIGNTISEGADKVGNAVEAAHGELKK